MDVSKTVSPTDSQPDHRVSRMVSTLDTWQFLSSFDGWPRVHTFILFVKYRLNFENFLIREKNIMVDAAPIRLQQFLGFHMSDLF